MGGAINRPFISVQFLLSTYFLTAQTYKRMRLITQVYGIWRNRIQGALQPGLESAIYHLHNDKTGELKHDCGLLWR